MENVQTLDVLSDLLASCPQWLFVANREGAVTHVSASLAEFFGPEFSTGSKLAERVHPDDRHVLETAWSQLGGRLTPMRIELRMKSVDGSYRRVCCSARISFTSGAVHGGLQELATSEQELEALRQSDKILKAILDNLPLAITIYDRQGIIQYFDGKGVTLYGKKPGERIGKNYFEIYPNAESQDSMRRAITGETVAATLELHGITLEAWLVPSFNQLKEVSCVIGLVLIPPESQRTRVGEALPDRLALLDRQQEVIHSLSTPIIEVWDKVLTLPMVGVVDSERAAEVMNNLLSRVSQQGARFAILDVTGVEGMDTGSAAHLIRLIQAIRLLGAEGIISGIRPNLAQTMVEMGMEFGPIASFTTLREALQYCIRRMRGPTT